MNRSSVSELSLNQRRSSGPRAPSGWLLVVTLSVALVAAFAVPATAGSGQFPETIPLPDGFQPEGIAVAPGGTFYAGSIPTGDIYRGDVRTGEGDVFIDAPNDRAAIGLTYDRSDRRLFVAGGPTGQGYAYDTETGETLATYDFTDDETFVNDVVITKDAAYFTDSVNPVVYRVNITPNGTLGEATTIPLRGDIEYLDGFNVNGIDAAPSGDRLFLVQSNTGKLFTLDPSDGTTDEIDLDGDTVTNGDGILLDGKTLYVVQNRDNQIAVVRLSSNFESGEVVNRLTDDDFDVPTTIDESGSRLYAVNARFGTTDDPQRADYSVVKVRK